ncbi:MAG TPA: Fic family protein [Patescibacteria group bacterium]|nr:Fic family protein [Patescibacteria group bacterium]
MPESENMYSPRYTITTKMLKYIGLIEGSKQFIDHAPLLPYYEKKFRDDAMLRAAHYGTHLEGNELNLAQAEKVLQGQDVVARERDVQEVINYRRAMEFISNLHTGKQKEKVDEKLLLELHRLTVDRTLPDEKVGHFRSTQVVIRNSFTGEVSFRPPEAAAIPGQITEFIAFINDSTDESIHPLLKSGIVHYEFVRIHPFVDGNGRVGRCLSTLILYQEGYDIRKFFSLEEYFDKHAAEYYASLQSVANKEGDLTDWLEFFLEALAVELLKIKEKVERISVDGKLKEKLGGAPLLLSERQLKIIEYLQSAGYLQNNAFKQLFPFVSEDTVLNELKSLIESGIVKKVGKTKAAKYVMA